MSTSSTTAAAAPVAVVTGGNRGLGREVCRQLAGSGVQVCMTSRDESDGEAAAASIRAAVPGAIIAVRPLDVADAASVATFAGYVREAYGTIDVLVNNAGASFRGFDANVVARTLSVNCLGAVRVTDTLLPLMASAGVIVMVSSGMGELSCLGPAQQAAFTDPELDREGLIALCNEFLADVSAGRHADRGWPSSAYRVSKVALNAFTRLLDRALRESDSAVRVNAVCPGWVRTDMGGEAAPRGVEEGADTITWAALGADGATGGFFRDRAPIGW